MCSKRLNLCSFFFLYALSTSSTSTSAQFANVPDVEFLPAVSAVSSQVMHRIHNKLIPGPLFQSPLISANPFPVLAPLSIFPQPTVPPLSTSFINFALSQPVAPIKAPLVAAPRPLTIPISQKIAPLVQSFGVVSSPFIAPPFASASLVVGPPAVAPAQFRPPPLLRSRQPLRLNNRSRPSAVRRFAANLAYQRIRL